MLTALFSSFFALSQADAGSVLRAVGARQQERWATVQNYTVVQRYQGLSVPIYHERMEVDGETTFRVVPQPEWERARTGLSREQTVAIAEGMATGLEMIGDAHLREAGPGGAYIKSMTSEMAMFLREVRKYDEDETRRAAAAEVRMGAAFAQRARLAGRAQVGGRAAHVVRADGLGDVKLERAPGSPEFRLERITLWIDEAEKVPLRLVMEGGVAGSRSPVVIELLEQDYEQAGPLYEPTRRTMRITGLMEAMATDPKKQRELQKARESAAKSEAELERMEERLASMPESQRRLIEGQLTKAREQMKMMANEGKIEVEVKLKVIGVNQGPPLDWRPGQP